MSIQIRSVHYMQFPGGINKGGTGGKGGSHVASMPDQAYAMRLIDMARASLA